MKRISIPANPKSILLLGAALAAVAAVFFVSELAVGAGSQTSLRSFSFSSASGTMSSGSYGISAELGPVGFVGRSSSANYSLQSGFVAADNVTSSIPPIAVPAVTLLGLVAIGAVMFALFALRRRNARRGLETLA